jgi:hypothetical protein
MAATGDCLLLGRVGVTGDHLLVVYFLMSDVREPMVVAMREPSDRWFGTNPSLRS